MVPPWRDPDTGYTLPLCPGGGAPTYLQLYLPTHRLEEYPSRRQMTSAATPWARELPHSVGSSNRGHRNPAALQGIPSCQQGQLLRGTNKHTLGGGGRHHSPEWGLRWHWSIPPTLPSQHTASTIIFVATEGPCLFLCPKGRRVVF